MRHSILVLVGFVLLAVTGAVGVTAQDEQSAQAHPGDGMPDPAGRIAFGRITRQDELFGQVAALFAIDPDGSDLVQLTDGESAFPAWSPDGSRLAFTQGLPDGSWQISTMAPDGSDVRVLTSGPGIHEVPSWSPDGSWIAYDYSPILPDDPAFHTIIYRMDADGSNQALLGDPDTFDVEPRISPDGTKVVFARLTGEGDEWSGSIVVRDVASGEELEFESAGAAIEHPAWSPDGDWIVYNVAGWMTGDPADEQIWRVRADGSGEPDLVVAGSPSFKPTYSPEGGSLLHGCQQTPGDDAACITSADGSDSRVLVDEPGIHENHFSWGVSEAATVTVVARDLAFDPSEVTVSSSHGTVIQLINNGRVTHNLTIDELGVQVVVPAGGTGEVTVEGPEPGATYQFYCSVSGHREAGMVGTITVR